MMSTSISKNFDEYTNLDIQFSENESWEKSSPPSNWHFQSMFISRCYFARNLEQFEKHTFWGKRRNICTFFHCINKSFEKWHIFYLLIIWGVGMNVSMFGISCSSSLIISIMLWSTPLGAPSPLAKPSIIVVIHVNHDHVDPFPLVCSSDKVFGC